MVLITAPLGVPHLPPAIILRTHGSEPYVSGSVVLTDPSARGWGGAGAVTGVIVPPVWELRWSLPSHLQASSLGIRDKRVDEVLLRGK